MDIRAKIKQLGLELPAAPKPVADYVPAVQAGKLVFISGQLPLAHGKLVATGPVPSAVTLIEATEAAQQCTLNALAVLDDHLGGHWPKFDRIVRVAVFVCSDAGFAEQAKVANGASELLGKLFGDAGRHARTTLGLAALPLGASVEVELTAQVR